MVFCKDRRFKVSIEKQSDDTLMRQYKRGGTYISDLQLKKIEDGIHALGRDFTHLKLV
ncbi:MAG: hypothetical protein LUB83_04210 [Prevotellaceae bacterium]|nr:hypothetical protein [Prevotellaceae bacterium]